MADITVTAANVAEYNAVTGFNLIRSRMTAVAMTAGQAVAYDTNGKAVLADADSATLGARDFDGIALETKGADQMVRVLEEGWAYGYTLPGAYGAPVYVSATAGALADAGDANGATIAGYIDWRTDAGGTYTKVLRIARSARTGAAAEKKLVVITLPTGAAIHAAVAAALNLWTNPEAGSVLITRAILNITTQSTGAATADIGTNATTLTASDNLIDGISLAATGVFDNTVSGGTNGKGGQVLATGKFVTIHEASGDSTGVVGTLVLEYINL